MTVGALVAFNMLAGRVSGPLVQMVTMAHEYQEVALAVKMLGEVMNQKPERDGARQGLAAGFRREDRIRECFLPLRRRRRAWRWTMSPSLSRPARCSASSAAAAPARRR